jgi:hypothetical protein
LTHYPVLTLAAISAVGCILALTGLLTGFVWLAVLVFVTTTLVLCVLIAIWIRRSEM